MSLESGSFPLLKLRIYSVIMLHNLSGPLNYDDKMSADASILILSVAKNARQNIKGDGGIFIR